MNAYSVRLPLALALLCAPLAAQAPFVDTIDVRLANLEVVVSDRDGHPVTGLGVDDFEVTEDGQPVEITHFAAVEKRVARTPSEGDTTPEGAAGTESGVVEAVPETRQLNLVVYVDDFNLHPRNRNPALASLREFLREELDPRDRVMLVRFDGDVDVVQPFTHDAEAALAVLDQLEAGTARQLEVISSRRRLLRGIQTASLVERPPPTALDQSDFQAAEFVAETLMGDLEQQIRYETDRLEVTLTGLERFVASLAGLPGRKAFLYISDGLPERAGEELVQAFANKFEQWAAFNNVGRLLGSLQRLRNGIPSNTRRFGEMARQAAVHRVAIYPISAGRATGGSPVSAEVMGSDTATGAGAYSADVAVLESFNLEGSLLRFAEESGGVAFTRSTNLSGLLEEMVEDFSTFYSLGYPPPPSASEGFHEVEVRVKGRPELRVRHVSGYEDVDPLEELRNLTLSSLFYDFQDNPLEVAVVLGQQRETAASGYRVPLLLKIPFRNIALIPGADGEFEGRIVAYVVVQDGDGGVSPFQRVVLPIKVPPGKFEDALEADAGYQVDLSMRRGPHRVAVAVRDLTTQLQSTLSADLVVGRGRN